MYDLAETRPHGDDALRALGHGATDFSVNLNPYGPAPAVRQAARDAVLCAYPETTARAAREVWAEQLDCAPGSLVFGHGAAELIWQVARVLLRPGDRCGVLSPAFGEPFAAARAVGAQVCSLPAAEDCGFRHDERAVAEGLRAGDFRLVYLCSPNNPTGAHLPWRAIVEWVRACPKSWFLLDQSFLALSDHEADLRVALPERVIALRSLTKEHALAGLRVGYLRCQQALARRLEHARPAWPTSAPAQAAARAAASHEAFVRASWRRMRADRDELTRGLVALGLCPIPSATSFQLVPVPGATLLAQRLAERDRIAVRDARSFGLPNYLRLAARPARDRERLLAALGRELGR